MTSSEKLQTILLNYLFKQAADAGFGRVERRDGGVFFEAFPGCEDAAADFIEAKLNEEIEP